MKEFGEATATGQQANRAIALVQDSCRVTEFFSIFYLFVSTGIIKNYLGLKIIICPTLLFDAKLNSKKRKLTWHCGSKSSGIQHYEPVFQASSSHTLGSYQY